MRSFAQHGKMLGPRFDDIWQQKARPPAAGSSNMPFSCLRVRHGNKTPFQKLCGCGIKYLKR
jgi:hypothetical protein